MTYPLFHPATSPSSVDSSFFSSKSSFTNSAEPPKPAPDRIDNNSSLQDRLAYYQAWVADERASENAAKGDAPNLAM